ncbi:ABC-type amino acid transport substrate-binding protein [Bradyrhizobium diazoefficiens]
MDYLKSLGDRSTQPFLMSSPRQAMAQLPSSSPTSRPGTARPLEFTKLYNGACTRLGEKEINAFANDFIEKIRANGELAKIYQKWMNNPLPAFPDAIPGIPFNVS